MRASAGTNGADVLQACNQIAYRSLASLELASVPASVVPPPLTGNGTGANQGLQGSVAGYGG